MNYIHILDTEMYYEGNSQRSAECVSVSSIVVNCFCIRLCSKCYQVLLDCLFDHIMNVTKIVL